MESEVYMRFWEGLYRGGSYSSSISTASFLALILNLYSCQPSSWYRFLLPGELDEATEEQSQDSTGRGRGWKGIRQEGVVFSPFPGFIFNLIHLLPCLFYFLVNRYNLYSHYTVYSVPYLPLYPNSFFSISVYKNSNKVLTLLCFCLTNLKSNIWNV